MNKNKIILLFVFFLALLIFSAAKGAPAKIIKQMKPTVVSQPQPTATVYLAEALNTASRENDPKQKNNSAPSTLNTVIELLVSLLFVIGLIYLVTAGLKFFYIKASIPMKSENVVKVIAKEYIDSKTIMYVVEFADKVLLLGNAGQSLNVLSEITDRETIDKLKQQADEYVSKYKIKAENRFDQQLKTSYLQQGKKLINNGNDMIKGIISKFKKKDDKPK
ncbi:MAG: flagellar biosynthetic protein FliO [bacterium]